MKKHVLLITLTILSLMPAVVLGNTMENDTLQRARVSETIYLSDEIIVTATRSRRIPLDIPFRVESLGRKSIESVNGLSADDYLRFIPGISVSRGAAFLSGSTVSLRGMGSSQGRTLVLVDGVPVNKTDGGSVNWNAIDATDIERIEVIKGPGSSLHGGNAMGGVIQFITPVPDQAFRANIAQSAGSFGTYQTRLGAEGKAGAFTWNVSGMYRESDGYITSPADEINEYSVASFLNEYRFGGKIGYFAGARTHVEAAGSYYSGQRGTGSNYSGYGFVNEAFASEKGAYNTYSGSYGRTRLRHEFEKGALLQVVAYVQSELYENIRESFRSNTLTRYDVESERDESGILSTLEFAIGSSHKLTAGADLRHGRVDGADKYLTSTDLVINRGKMNQLGLYVQDEVSIGTSPWSVLGGIRFDYARFYDGEFQVNDPTQETRFLQNFSGALETGKFQAVSPRISTQYHLKGKLRTYASISKGFRPPVLDDMSRTGRISGGMKIANPDLKPEYLDNFELGGDVFLGRNIVLSPTVFYSNGTDFHAYVSTGDSLVMSGRLRPIRKMANIGKVTLKGLEFSANWSIGSHINWSAAYAHTQSEIIQFEQLNPATDPDLIGKAITYQPKDLFSTAVRLVHPWINAHLSFHYKGAQWMNDMNTEQIDPYYFVDLNIWRRLAGGLHASLKIHNLLNAEYIDSRNTVAPGRMFTAELQYRF